jgi:hypothetical protein
MGAPPSPLSSRGICGSGNAFKAERRSGGIRCSLPAPATKIGWPIQALFWLEWDNTAPAPGLRTSVRRGWKWPTLKARTRISCHAALERTACAPFHEERRMKLTGATKFHRKSGGGPTAKREPSPEGLGNRSGNGSERQRRGTKPYLLYNLYSCTHAKQAGKPCPN